MRELIEQAYNRVTGKTLSKAGAELLNDQLTTTYNLYKTQLDNPGKVISYVVDCMEMPDTYKFLLTITYESKSSLWAACEISKELATL